MSQNADHIDQLLDAIELVKLDRREEACDILRGLIRENGDFEDAWLWMSVAVDSLDQSSVCRDNVLRINPDNAYAAGALFLLRESDMLMQERRNRLYAGRNFSWAVLWLLIIVLSFAVMFTYAALLTPTPA